MKERIPLSLNSWRLPQDNKSIYHRMKHQLREPREQTCVLFLLKYFSTTWKFNWVQLYMHTYTNKVEYSFFSLMVWTIIEFLFSKLNNGIFTFWKNIWKEKHYPFLKEKSTSTKATLGKTKFLSNWQNYSVILKSQSSANGKFTVLSGWHTGDLCAWQSMRPLTSTVTMGPLPMSLVFSIWIANPLLKQPVNETFNFGIAEKDLIKCVW